MGCNRTDTKHTLNKDLKKKKKKDKSNLAISLLPRPGPATQMGEGAVPEQSSLQQKNQYHMSEEERFPSPQATVLSDGNISTY